MRVWVARPEPGAARTAERLAALGHRPLLAPVLEIRATGEPLPAGAFAGAILTSAAAIPALAAGAWRPDGRPVFAVGARTAALARAAGLGPVLEGGGDGRALADRVRETLEPGARLLHVAGAERKDEPARSLSDAGFRVTVHLAYAAVPVARLPEAADAALAQGAVEAALHYSRRSAAAALDLARGANRWGAFRGLRHYCLSDDVAVPLAAAGVAVHFVAARPREDDLLAGLT